MSTSLSRNARPVTVLALLVLCFIPGGQVCQAQTDGLARAWEQFTPKPTIPSPDGLGRTWERYFGKLPVPGRGAYPGRLVGDDATLSAFMKISGWQHRASCYELYFASSRSLARSIYGLALHSGDIDGTMPQERFERGVRGFHYSASQVCAWVNAILAEAAPLHSDEERQLIFWLLKDGVVNIRNGAAMPGTTIHHVLGAAPGQKRGFEATLRHERLHVLWDEDPTFAAEYRGRWDKLSEDEKQAARKKLSAYAQDNEAQLIEEWAVTQAESMPEEGRKRLVGL